MDLDCPETWFCLWLCASTSDEDHARFLQACREHSAACINCCSSADLIQAVLGAALTDSSCSANKQIGKHCVRALLTKSLTLGALKESEAARLFGHCLLQPPLITHLPSAAALLQLADAAATREFFSDISELANLQRQAVVLSALLAEPLPLAVRLAAALFADPCPGSGAQQPACANQQPLSSKVHPSSKLVQLWDFCVSSTGATEASAAAVVRLAASCGLMSQSTLGAVMPLLESIVAQAQAPAQLRETAFAGILDGWALFFNELAGSAQDGLAGLAPQILAEHQSPKLQQMAALGMARIAAKGLQSKQGWQQSLAYRLLTACLDAYVPASGDSASQQVAETLHASFQHLDPFITKENVMDLTANLLMRAVRSSTFCVNAYKGQGAVVVPAQDGAAKQLQLKLKCLLKYHGLSLTEFEAVSAAAVDACSAVCPMLSCDSIVSWLSDVDFC